MMENGPGVLPPSHGTLRTIVAFNIHVVDDFADITSLKAQYIELREIASNIVAIIKHFSREIASYSPVAGHSFQFIHLS